MLLVTLVGLICIHDCDSQCFMFLQNLSLKYHLVTSDEIFIASFCVVLILESNCYSCKVTIKDYF